MVSTLQLSGRVIKKVNQKKKKTQIGYAIFTCVCVCVGVSWVYLDKILTTKIDSMKTSLFDLRVRMVEGSILWLYLIKSFYTQTLDTD